MANVKQLFPVFDIPAVTVREDEQADALLPGPLFDYEMGDFARDGANRVLMVDGLNSYIIWCLKMLQTQLGACEAYPESGIDMEGAMAQPNRQAVQSELERTITEGLRHNPHTERVYGFSFSWRGDELTCMFVVKPRNLPVFELNLTVTQ